MNKLISVVVPCRNEHNHIANVIEQIKSQALPSGYEIEILVADGCSNDGTREILAKIVLDNNSVKLIDNQDKIVSAGLNAAIRNSRGSIIIRMDCHTDYNFDYIYQCIKVLEQTGADNVGGPWYATGNSFLQKAIAIAFQSFFASGGAGSHRIDFEGYVDSVYLGCWRKETLIKIGLFDEELVRNQDDELNFRIIQSGGKIYQSPKIKSKYYSRSSLKALFKQYMQYGYWKFLVIRKYKIPASIRHIIPGLFVFLVILFPFLSLFNLSVLFLWFGLIASYIIANLVASVITCREKKNWRYVFMMPFVFGAYHFGYGCGFILSLFDVVVLRNNQVKRIFSELTR